MRNHKVLLEKVERYTEVPMLILVVVMIVTLVVPMVWQVNQKTESVLEVIDWIIWALFALELAVKTYLSEQRLRYLRTHWIDVIVVVVPLLRVFRIFRIARLARSARLLRSTRSLRIFRLVRILAFFTKFITEIKTIFTRHGFNYLFIVKNRERVLILLSLIFFIAIILHLTRKSHNSNLSSVNLNFMQKSL